MKTLITAAIGAALIAGSLLGTGAAGATGDPYSSDGTWLVPSEIAPGTYRAAVKPGSFAGMGYYKTCADYTCEIGTDGFIDNGLLQGPGIVLVPSNAVSVKNIDDLLHEHAPYYDRQGNRIGFMEWGAKFEDKEYQHVARWEDGDLSVSTVWLGIDHGWRAGGPPIIFETMIFGGEHNQERTRYVTEAEAIEGHNRTVADVQAGCQPWFL